MSSSASPHPKAFARRLLAYEAASGENADANAPAAFRVCEQLKGPLSKVMGTGGFRSLLSRALALSGAEIPWLRALHIKADGTLEGMGKLEAELDRHAVAEGEVVLVAQLLGLLVTFIGPALTLGLLHDIWPKIDDPDL